MRLVTKREVVTTTHAVTTSTSTPIDVRRAKLLSVQAIVDVNLPAATVVAAASVSEVTDAFTSVAHGLTTGLKGQMTTSAADLPDGLALLTDYFVIVLTADTYQLASSLANALAGTEIDLIDAGTGNHTFTPTALAGATVTLQKSNNYDPKTGVGTFDAVEAATSITADANIWISDIDPEYEYVRLSYTLTAGRLSASSIIVIKEDR